MVASGKISNGLVRNKEDSPFTPGNPVPVELFVGREAQIEEIRRYARQACSGRLENIFLTGDRGIGKSSLARFVIQLCRSDCGILGVHVMLGGVSTVEELVRRVFEEVLKETHTLTWFEKIRGLFGNFVQKVGLLGVSVEFHPPKERLEAVARDFPTALKTLIEAADKEIGGLLIVLDDLNGLANSATFANWYKSLVDSVAVHGWRLPVLFLLCGLPERRDSLARLQPSLMRIFHVVEVERLSDAEVQQFFSKSFARAQIVVDPWPMERMKYCSSGLPTLMHEVGDAVFWADDDGFVDDTDVENGITKAAEEVGRKYLDPTVYRAIRSDRYRAILDKVAEPYGEEFSKQEMEERLDEHEKRVFDNFLHRMKHLGVIAADQDFGPGVYRFVNPLFPIYIRMQRKVTPPPRS